MANGLRAVDRGLGLVEQLLLVFLLVLLVGVAAAQAVAGQLGTSWEPSYELIRYAVFFIAMIGAALSAQRQQLIAMDFMSRLMGPRMRAWVQVVLRLFTIFACGLLVAAGTELANAAATENMYHLIQPRLGLMALPVGAGLIALHVLIHGIVDVMYLVRGALPPEGGAPIAH